MAIYKGYASYLYNSIGIPGQTGFGVGICPEQNLPPLAFDWIGNASDQQWAKCGRYGLIRE
jgi:hypothetical protein